MRTHDLIIIGSGSGNSLLGPEHDDLDVAIVERGRFGGTCLNVGCIPSKMLVYAAELADLARNAGPRLGIHTRVDGVDWPGIRDRIFGRIDHIAEGGRQYREDLPNVTVYPHDARFVGPRTVQVGNDTITADQIVIAAGGRPQVPSIPGLTDNDLHTSDTIMRMDALPSRLAIIGGGFIAAELGSVFGGLGADVTFVVRSHRMLTGEDLTISEAFTASYQQRHQVRLATSVTRAERNGDDIVLHLSTGDSITVDAVLAATGRIPNTDQLDLAQHGYQLDHAGYLVTDENLATSIEGVWALGDITNPVQLKHVANHEARVVRHNLSHPNDLRAVNHQFIPHAVFGHPQVASVGLTETQAEQQGLAFSTVVQPFAAAAYGWAMEDTSSLCKLVMDTTTRRLLGAHIIGPQASTLIQQLIQGMAFGQTVDELASGQYYIHPALPEVVEQALLEL